MDSPKPIDPLGEALDSAFQTVAPLIRDFYTRVCGPLLTQVGGTLGDQFRYWRWLNLLRLCDQAAAKLRARGVDPSPVPPRTLGPLFEAASLEDDDALKEKWSSLLANAADPDGTDVMPSYPSVLRNLSPTEVAILDWLSDRPLVKDPQLSGSPDTPLIRIARQDELEGQFPLKPGQFEVLAAHLHAEGICDAGHRYVVTRSGGSGTSSRFYSSIRMTPFGEAFVKACRYT